MAFIKTESFDSYADSTDADDLQLNWTVEVPTASGYTFLTGRNGVGKCVRMGSGTRGFSTGIANVSAVQVAFSFYAEDIPGSTKPICQLLENGTTHCSINIESSGSLTAVRPGFTLHSSSKLLRTTRWYTFKLLMTISDSISANEFILLVNDEEWLNVPATADTKSGLTGLANSFMIGDTSAQGFSRRYDDFIMQTPGDAWLDEHRVDTIRPNGNGTTNQLLGSDADSVDNYLHVDEVAPDRATSYVESSTATEIDLYNLESLPFTPASIYCVNPCAIVQKDAAGARTVKQLIRTGAANFEGATEHFPANGSWGRVEDPFSQNPDTVAAWVVADVDALQSGIKIES